MASARIALLSNASSYVGPAMAREWARRGHDLVLGDPTDELVAETSLAAEHAFSVYKRAGLKRKADPAADPRRPARRTEPHDDRPGASE